MNHFILTRLNQKWVYRDLHLDYMHYRLDLFELTCLPSIRNQSDKNFKHIVVTSPTIPDCVRKRTESYENVDVVYYDNANGKQVFSKEFCISLKSKYNLDKNDFIITTGIDSDDIMRYDYIEEINKTFKKVNTFPCLIKNKGFYVVGKNFSNYANYSGVCSSPLFSVVEKVNDMRSCYCRGHRCIHESVNGVISIDNPQIMICNVSNNHMKEGGRKAKIRNVHINYEDYGVNKNDLISFLSKDMGEEYVSRERKVREYRRAYRRLRKENCLQK